MIEILIGDTPSARLSYHDPNNLNYRMIQADIEIVGQWWLKEPFLSAGAGSEFIALALDGNLMYTKKSDGSWAVLR